MNVQVSDSPADCAKLAADLTAASLKRAQDKNGSATFVLAGGSLPPVAYAQLVENHGASFDWTRVKFAIGDERICGWDGPDNSWLLAMPMFAAHPEIPAENLLRPLSEQSAEDAAAAYQTTVESLRRDGSAAPALDTVWLGMGEDGHTLSLFPNHPSLNPTDQLVIPVHDSPKPPSDRITLTLNALANVTDAYILAVGAGKVDILVEAMKADSMLPIAQVARQIEANGGNVTWLLDTAAAANL